MCSKNDIFSSARFKVQGFDNFLQPTDKEDSDLLCVRVNAFNRADFERWKQVYCELTCTSLNSVRLLPSGEGHKRVFGQKLKCHHGAKHKGVKKTPTG